MLEVQILGPYPKPTESESLEVVPRICVFIPRYDSDAY